MPRPYPGAMGTHPDEQQRDTGPVLPLAASAGYQIRATHRLVQRTLQSRIEPCGVSLGMWYFLRVLWEGDGLTQSELSQRVGTMEPTTLSAIRDMERNGFVRRTPHETDRRKINIHLTDEGRALRARLMPHALAVIDQLLHGLTEREVAMLLSLLAAMQRNLSDGPDSPER